MKEKEKNKRVLKIGMLLLFVFSFLFLGFLFWQRNLVIHQPKIEMQDIMLPDREMDPKILEMRKLLEENGDLIGWLTIPDTKIDYPVLFTRGEDYYLRRDFYKEKSTAGSLYIDKHADMAPRDINILIHGHNMNNGTMFHDLLNYKKKSFYEDHKTFFYYTLEEKEEYEIIAVFLSKVYNVQDEVFKYYQFYGEQDEESYQEYIKNITELSLYSTGNSATYPEELITLSTCEYSKEDGRLVVVGKRVS